MIAKYKSLKQKIYTGTFTDTSIKQFFYLMIICIKIMITMYVKMLSTPMQEGQKES